jgi:hypothetical protein
LKELKKPSGFIPFRNSNLPGKIGRGAVGNPKKYRRAVGNTERAKWIPQLIRRSKKAGFKTEIRNHLNPKRHRRIFTARYILQEQNLN